MVVVDGGARLGVERASVLVVRVLRERDAALGAQPPEELVGEGSLARARPARDADEDGHVLVLVEEEASV